LAGKPFEIELHLHGDQVVKYSLSEEDVRARARTPRNRLAATALALTTNADERTRLRSAAYQLVHEMLDPESSPTVSVVEGDAVWVIPVASIRAVRLVDGEVAGDSAAFSFVDRASSEI
jgi:hypothetical protein